MDREGDDAPDFTAPVADGDIGPFTLSEALDEEAPIVLAFFPGAFTSVCTSEMCEFRDRLGAFEAVDATVYGVSVDSPFALAEFRDAEDLGFGLIADTDKELIDAYDVRIDYPHIGYHGLAQRAVFVVDDEGVVTYAWVAEDARNEPDYDAVEAAAAEAREA